MRTVYGVVADELGHASAAGRHCSSPAADYLRVQGPEIRSITITITAGSARSSSSRGTAGGLWAVGEVYDAVAEAVHVRVGGRTVAVPIPLFWSREPDRRADDGLLLDSVSLTASPARVFPRPVRFLDGCLDHRRRRSGGDHGSTGPSSSCWSGRRTPAPTASDGGDPIMLDESPSRRAGEARSSRGAGSTGWRAARQQSPAALPTRLSTARRARWRVRPCTILRVR